MTFRAWWILGIAAAAAENVTIFKVGYPETSLCGQEDNVSKSSFNPHYFFPVHFGGFQEGQCSDAGYNRFVIEEEVEMHPFPFVKHNLTFKLFSRPGGPDPPIQTIQLKDPERSNRTVTAKICMPPATSAEKQWPLYVFGHGFDCAPESYAYFCEVAVTALVYEYSPVAIDLNTASLAKDASFLAEALPLSAEDSSSPLHGKLDGSVFLGGHSMGGGTSVLAAAQPSERKADGMVVFAPGLYTIPSANPYLKDVSLPTLIVSGADDCGPNALPKQSQPAYDGLSSAVKFLVVLKGANHCQWAQATSGVCGGQECGHLKPGEQRRQGMLLAEAFFEASREGWDSLEGFLRAGEQQGRWSFLSSRTSEPGKALHNSCPCKAEATAEVLV